MVEPPKVPTRVIVTPARAAPEGPEVVHWPIVPDMLTKGVGVDVGVGVGVDVAAQYLPPVLKAPPFFPPHTIIWLPVHTDV